MPLWKSILLKAAGFGAGFVLMLCVIAGSWAWYEYHPRPWNRTAIKAKFNGFTYQARQEAFVITFEYILTNNTKKDYTLPSDTPVFSRMVYDAGYGDTLNTEIVGNPFIPAGHEMMFKIRVSYKYDELDTTFEKTVDEKQSEIFAFKRLNRIDSFELFDKENKYEIDFPNEWKDWDKVKDAFKN